MRGRGGVIPGITREENRAVWVRKMMVIQLLKKITGIIRIFSKNLTEILSGYFSRISGRIARSRSDS
jgi:hypothetical protein